LTHLSFRWTLPFSTDYRKTGKIQQYRDERKYLKDFKICSAYLLHLSKAEEHWGRSNILSLGVEFVISHADFSCHLCMKNGHPIPIAKFEKLISEDLSFLHTGCSEMDCYALGFCTVPKTKRLGWFKAIWNGFFRSHERKEENPRNYYSLRARERKNTFYLTLNQSQHLTFGTVCYSIENN
jgi:hypothetical protein